jgi:3-methyladenine DNA glycosylase AlkD
VNDADFDAETAAAHVVAALLPLADPERAVQEKRYLKSDLDFLGVRVPGIRAVVTEAARPHRDLGRDSVLAWARALWREPVHERRAAAIEVLRRYVRNLDAADLAQLEAWIRAAHGWAYVDPLAGDIAGRVAMWHPEGWPAIDAWTRSHLGQLSGVTFREAVRRLPPEQAARLQAAYSKRADG